MVAVGIHLLGQKCAPPTGQDRSESARKEARKPMRRIAVREVDGNRCFYCAATLRGEPVVDHFVPWARYPLDLGHNFVLADARCNGGKLDRLAAFEHLERWCTRNARPDWTGGARQEDAAPRRPTHEAGRPLGLRPGRAGRRHRLAAGA
jgi:5-methylcytosine-specific restriction endonuclease McrA